MSFYKVQSSQNPSQIYMHNPTNRQIYHGTVVIIAYTCLIIQLSELLCCSLNIGSVSLQKAGQTDKKMYFYLGTRVPRHSLKGSVYI